MPLCEKVECLPMEAGKREMKKKKKEKEIRNRMEKKDVWR